MTLLSFMLVWLKKRNQVFPISDASGTPIENHTLSGIIDKCLVQMLIIEPLWMLTWWGKIPITMMSFHSLQTPSILLVQTFILHWLLGQLITTSFTKISKLDHSQTVMNFTQLPAILCYIRLVLSCCVLGCMKFLMALLLQIKVPYISWTTSW